jgi:hypothetical protein
MFSYISKVGGMMVFIQLVGFCFEICYAKFGGFLYKQKKCTFIYTKDTLIMSYTSIDNSILERQFIENHENIFSLCVFGFFILYSGLLSRNFTRQKNI